MLFESIGILDENLDYQPSSWVGIEGDTITYIGAEPPEHPERFGETYDGSGKLLMSALFNAHSHAPMTLLRGYAENLPLQAWLNEKCWPYEAKMTQEDNYWGTKLALAEMARFGVVSYSDMYYATPERVQATDEASMKANLCEGLLAFEPKPYREYPIYELNETYVREYDGTSDGRIRIDYCIHAEYTSNEQVCRDIVDIVKDKGLRLHIHASETRSEVEECRERHGGLSPIQYFNALGVFDVPCTAAHCVWVDADDIAILADKGVFVANNPASNMKLASGFAPIAAMLEAGVPLCLGTDGMASNNNHNMFKDLYLMALIYKGYALDPTIITSKQALFAATRGGALSQGRDDCGLVKEGYKADLCVLDIGGPSWWPVNDMLTNVVYAGHGSDVVLTLCDGNVIYRDGTWLGVDVEKAAAEVAARTKRIQSEL